MCQIYDIKGQFFSSYYSVKRNMPNLLNDGQLNSVDVSVEGEILFP